MFWKFSFTILKKLQVRIGVPECKMFVAISIQTYEFGWYCTIVVARATSLPIRSNINRLTPYAGDGIYRVGSKLVLANKRKSA